MVLFSIVIPAYNRAWCIKRCIDSCLSQDIRDFEIIVVDDGSSDNTKDIVKKIRDKRIRYHKFKTNKGVNFARNKGMDLSAGNYLIFLDSDDVLVQNSLELIKSKLDDFKDKKIGSIVFYAQSEKGHILGEKYKNKTRFDFIDIIKGKLVDSEKLYVFPKKVYENFRFPDLPGQLEGIFYNRITKNYDFLLYRECARIYFTSHADRLTGTGQMVKKARYQDKHYELMFKEFHKDYAKYNPKKLSKFYLEKGLNEIISSKPDKGRNSLRSALKYNPKKRLLVSTISALSYLPTNMFIQMAILGHRYKKVLR